MRVLSDKVYECTIYELACGITHARKVLTFTDLFNAQQKRELMSCRYYISLVILLLYSLFCPDFVSDDCSTVVGTLPSFSALVYSFWTFSTKYLYQAVS
jgi:hypothetical protein